MRGTRILFLLVLVATGIARIEAQAQPQPTSTSSPANAAPEVAAAEAAMAKSDWKAAAAQLDKWIAVHPTDARALFDDGYVADTQDQFDQAAALYRRTIAANPQSFEAHISLGLLLARHGKPTDARDELIIATKLEAGEAGPAMKARAWRALAEIDKPGPNYSGNAEQASNDLLEALKLSPETPTDTLLAANLADAQGQYDAAEAAYRRVLTSDPTSAQANAGLAHVLIVRKDYPEAEKLVRTALKQSPDSTELTAQLAVILAAQDDAEALPLLQKLHASRPGDAAITRMLADVLSQAGNDAESDKLYVSLLSASPSDAGLLVSHGQSLTRQLRYAEALTAFDRATQSDPANGDAWAGLAFAASKVHQPNVTLHALTMRSKFLPEVAATYFLWATSYDTLHEKAAAATYYHHFLDSALGKFPDQEWQARQRLLVLEKK